MRVERSGTINQPVERVFEYVSTPENDPTWVPVSLRHQKISPGPLRVGSITEEDVAFLGRQMRCVWEVCHYEPPSAFTARTVSGPLPATIDLLLEPLDSATELTLVVDAELRGFYRLMEPLMKWVVQGQFKTQLRTLKNLLESGTSENSRAS
jgi:Polyketide cyclase / dehydrase and lipid transport